MKGLYRTTDGKIFDFKNIEVAVNHQKKLFDEGATGKVAISMDHGKNWDWKFSFDGWKRVEKEEA